MTDDIGKNKSGINVADQIRRAAETLQFRIPKIPDYTFPAISSPEYRLPEIQIPSAEERNSYQSAAMLMQAIAQEAMQWKKQLPHNYKPAIIAIVYGGTQINVRTLSQVSFHGIRIEGTINEAPCSLLAHQSTVQLLCYGEVADPEIKHRPIGFVWSTNRIEV